MKAICKEHIIIAILLAISFWDAGPKMSEYAGLKQKLTLLKKQVAKERLFIQQQSEISRQLEAATQVYRENDKSVYPGDILPGAAMTQLQEMLQQTIKKNGLEMVNIRWGEPFHERGSTYLKLPISFLVKGSPPQVVGFLHELVKSEKVLKFPVLVLSKIDKDRVNLEAMVNAYQLEPQEK